MADLDSLLFAYRANPNLLDSLLSSAQRYAAAIAVAEKHPDPDEVAQRVVIKLWHENGKIMSSCRGWVARATRNIIHDDRAAARDTVSLDDDTEIVFDSARLSNWHNVPLELRKYAAMILMGYSLKEIAEKEGISDRALRKRLAPYKKVA